MWEPKTESLHKGEVIKHHVSGDSQQLTFAQVIRLWKENVAFADFFSAMLANISFPAFFWECPPLTQTTQHLPFEFVIVNSPQLSGVEVDADAFGEHFNHENAYVCSFRNLGGDAQLLAPVPKDPEKCYAHLATFIRNANRLQQQAFWQSLGSLVDESLSEQPLWLNTSGLGVYWLHVRLDTYPKYYQFAPYCHYIA